jgi:ribosomal protein S18 acetylase RimI-like enzyme
MDRREEKVVYREYRAEDRESLVKLHNTAFPPVTLEYWQEWDKQDVTASVALIGDEVVGCVPFHIRDFVVRPGVTVRAAFEYSVCVRENLRSRGIGSRLMDCAAKFLRGRADVMMVYRGGELSRGYRYYERNHHYDVVYIRPWRWQIPVAKPRSPDFSWDQRMQAHDIGAMYRREPEVIEVFNSCHGQFGGYPLRRPGHYQMMSHNANWEEVKHDWEFLEFTHSGRLMGYLLLGVRHIGVRRRGDACVAHPEQWRAVEWATRDGDLAIARTLLDHAALIKGAPLSLHLAEHDPLRGAMVNRGVMPAERAESSLMIMAKTFDPERLGKAVWDPNIELPETEVRVWSPLREACIYTGPGKTKWRIVLEMKDDILTRLLLSRLDLNQACRQELVTVVGATDEHLELIAKALPFCPWIHQNIDYI